MKEALIILMASLFINGVSFGIIGYGLAIASNTAIWIGPIAANIFVLVMVVIQITRIFNKPKFGNFIKDNQP